MKCSKNNPNGIVQKGKVVTLRYLYTGFYIIQCRELGAGGGTAKSGMIVIFDFSSFASFGVWGQKHHFGAF